MSKCKNMIMANSSFSWWAAWLNNHDDNIIISPKRWNNNINSCGVFCDEWITLGER